MKPKPPDPIVTESRLPVGTRVKLLRPNIWANLQGVVESHTPEFTVVRVSDNLGGWCAGAKHDELKVLP